MHLPYHISPYVSEFPFQWWSWYHSHTKSIITQNFRDKMQTRSLDQKKLLVNQFPLEPRTSYDPTNSRDILLVSAFHEADRHRWSQHGAISAVRLNALWSSELPSSMVNCWGMVGWGKVMVEPDNPDICPWWTRQICFLGQRSTCFMAPINLSSPKSPPPPLLWCFKIWLSVDIRIRHLFNVWNFSGSMLQINCYLQRDETFRLFRDVTGITQEGKIVSIRLAEMSVVVKRFLDIRKNQEQLPNGIW